MQRLSFYQKTLCKASQAPWTSNWADGSSPVKRCQPSTVYNLTNVMLMKGIPQERKCNWPDQDDWWLKTRNSGLSFHVFLGFTSSVFCTLGDWLQNLPTSIQYILYHLLQYNLKLPSNNSAKQVGTFNRAGRKISWVSLWPGQRALEHQSQDCQWCERIDH